MKPTTETIITALRSGLATRDELLEHHGCASEAMTKCTSNMLRRELITRYAETVDGKMLSAYRLTELGKAWKPDQRGVSLKKAMQKGKAAPSIADVSRDTTFDPVFEASDYEPAAMATMPEPDAKLLALANRELSAQLDAWRDVLYGYDCKTPEDLADFLIGIRSDLINATALSDKLQHLLDAKERECEALRATAPECCGKCAPDLETVPLGGLLSAVAEFLDEGQSITVYSGCAVKVNSFDREFVCTRNDANTLLDASAILLRAEVAA